ncbi:MAG TPA: hypothetical protein VK687_05285 [Bryobacteraceae bacterium]|nr:hypothetical protein [Bryobacteraceae bacterium]
MRINVMLRTVVVFTLASAAWGQVGGPVLGYLPNGNSIRTMYGLPAAGIVGAALNTGRALALSAVSPSQNFALGVAADTGELLLVTPSADGSTAAVSSVTAAAMGASRIVFSPDGSAAATWFPSTGHIQVITGLAGSPAVLDIDASFLGADPTSLAVSDDGQWVAGVWTQGLYAFGPMGQVTVLSVDAPVLALSFFHRRADIALATATQTITITDIGGSATSAVVWSVPADPAQPAAPAGSLVGIGVSFDNNSVVMAWDSGGVVTIYLAAGTATGADCGCTPAGIFGLGDSVFRLTGLNSGALKVFDAATGNVWFVPQADVGADGGQQ